MTNEIQKAREAIERGLVSAQLCPGGPVTELSPCGCYRLEIEEYAADGADFAVAVVRETDSGQEVDETRSHRLLLGVSLQVTVYDFHDPLSLPLPKLAEYVLAENNAQFEGWITEARFRVRSEDGAVCVFEVPEGKPTQRNWT